jgi:hypothetical protein
LLLPGLAFPVVGLAAKLLPDLGAARMDARMTGLALVIPAGSP